MPSTPPCSTAIEVRDSGIHGQGVFATRALRAGAVIGFYGGRVYPAEVVLDHDWNQQLTHVFGLSTGAVINGAEDGNETRFINHSCRPNCVAYEVDGDDGPAIRIEALRAIKPGAELFLDYGLDVGENDPLAYPCRCGAPRCRGTMVAPVEE